MQTSSVDKVQSSSLVHQIWLILFHRLGKCYERSVFTLIASLISDYGHTISFLIILSHIRCSDSSYDDSPPPTEFQEESLFDAERPAFITVARIYILEPLKSAACFGVIFSDPLGNLRWCLTPLASFIVDTPEVQLILCVGGKSSPVTLAKYDQFGHNFRHDSRTGATTLNFINHVNATPEAAESPEKI